MSPLFTDSQGFGELCDLKTDLNERCKLLDNPDYQAIKHRYLQLLINWSESLDDKVSFPKRKAPRNTGPYSLLQADYLQNLEQQFTGGTNFYQLRDG